MWNRFRRWRRGGADEELDREIQSHLAAEAEERAELGVPVLEAKEEARRAFGNQLRVKEEMRAVWGWGAAEDWFRDLCLAGRSLWRRPGFLGLAVMALATGIGAASGMFAIVYANLLAPLPYPEFERIVVIHDQLLSDPGARNLASPGQVNAWQNGADSFAALGGFTDAFFTLTGGGQDAERIPALLASREVLEILGARPLAGRIYSGTEAGGARGELLVSESLWRRRFGDAKLNGQTILVDDVATEVTGVLPASFQFLDRRYEAIRPLPPLSSRSAEANQRFRYLTVLGQLRPGASTAMATQQLAAVAQTLGEKFPQTDAERTVAVMPLDEMLRGPNRARTWLAMAAVCSLLLMACLNVGSLLLGRNLQRQRELTVRLALGAGRGDLFRQLACEALVLALLGGAAGLLLAELGLRVFGQPEINGAVAVFAAIVSTAAAMGIAVLPLRQVERLGRSGWRQGAMGAAGGEAGMLSRGVLLGMEVALAMLLLVSAGTAVRSLVRVLETDPGFQPNGAMAMELAMSRRNRPGQDGEAFLRRMEAELVPIPGVRSIGLTNRLPLGGDRSTRAISIGKAPDLARQEMTEVRRVSPGFLDAMGMRLIRGRGLSGRDTPETGRVALVNQRFAERYFGAGDPIGRQLFIQEGLDPQPAEIVGVVNDIRQAGLAADPQPEVYVSIFVRPAPVVTLVVRGGKEVLPAVRQRLAQLDPAMALAPALPLTDLIHGSAGPQRFLAFLLAGFSLLALLLAAVGIYGVAAFSVARRTGEIGIRIALGAGTFDIVGLVLGWVARVVVAGMVVGAGLSWAANRWASSHISGLDAPGLAVVAAAGIVFLAIALLASVGPALRASLVDPGIAQRSVD
jgi:putative ABC transport system permease protein